MNNNEIVGRLATDKAAEQYIRILAPDMDEQDMGDITQDTYLDLLVNEKLPNIKKRGKLKDYLFCTIKHKVSAYYKNRQCHIEYDEEVVFNALNEISGRWEC